jgi:hypothetical protein
VRRDRQRRRGFARGTNRPSSSKPGRSSRAESSLRALLSSESDYASTAHHEARCASLSVTLYPGTIPLAVGELVQRLLLYAILRPS